MEQFCCRNPTCAKCARARVQLDRPPIYAVYRFAGMTDGEARAAVCAEGAGTYRKRLDYTTDPGFLISC